MTLICMHCFISGHVQGVFYRRYVYDNALSLGLGGWVRNVPDGRVEAMLCGERQAIETLIHALWIGPTAAKVTDVQTHEVPFQQHEGFKVG